MTWLHAEISGAVMVYRAVIIFWRIVIAVVAGSVGYIDIRIEVTKHCSRALRYSLVLLETSLGLECFLVAVRTREAFRTGLLWAALSVSSVISGVFTLHSAPFARRSGLHRAAKKGFHECFGVD